jgi:AbrB family looped-hinge helix DNA binding protein
VYQQADTSIVTVKGQIVIPSRMRRRLGLKKGIKVSLVDRGDEIIIRALTKDYFEKMAGALKTGGKLTRALLEDRAADRAREDSR